MLSKLRTETCVNNKQRGYNQGTKEQIREGLIYGIEEVRIKTNKEYKSILTVGNHNIAEVIK